MDAFFESTIFTYVLIPILIMLSKIVEVTMGTVRIILVAKGNKRLAPFLGFFEVFIWIATMGIIVANLNNIFSFFFYALGFAAGNYVGIMMEERLAMGNVIVHVITKKKAGDLIRTLKTKKYRITYIGAQNNDGEVTVLYILVKRKNLDKLIKRIKTRHPKAFFSIEDVRFASEGMLPFHHPPERRNRTNFLKVSRHGK